MELFDSGTSSENDSSLFDPDYRTVLLILGACYLVFAIFPFVSVIRMAYEAYRQRREERATLLPREYSSNYGVQWVCCSTMVSPSLSFLFFDDMFFFFFFIFFVACLGSSCVRCMVPCFSLSWSSNACCLFDV